MIRNIFFDFDGVLAESVHIKTDAFRKMYLSHGEDFANRVVKHHLENGGMSRFEKFRIYQEWMGLESGITKINELASQFSDLVKQGVIDAVEVNGANEFLKKYFSQYSFWIVSGTPTDEVSDVADKRGIKKYFTGIFGSPEKKNDITEHIISTWNLDRKQSVFVGDATTDHNAAESSGIRFILRETTENSGLFIDFNGPKISDLTQLPDALSTL